ncbi:MAG: NAD-dependent epimerase/dehydratase family protein, partial [Patescibacteria group bacterium]
MTETHGVEGFDRKSRALVTGASGFMGTHMVDLLLANGYEVVATDIYGAKPYRETKARFIPADLTVAGDILYEKVRRKVDGWEKLNEEMEALYRAAEREESRSLARVARRDLASSAEISGNSTRALVGEYGEPNSVMPKTSSVAGSKSTVITPSLSFKKNLGYLNLGIESTSKINVTQPSKTVKPILNLEHFNIDEEA